MSTTIDQKVVEMRFDNQQFETNVKTSLSTLDKLKQSLNLEKSAQGFEDIGKAANKLNFNGLSYGIEQVGKHFSAMEVIGITALANLTNSAVNAGKRIVEAMTIRAPKDGFAEYELKMGSIQTIMASTGENIETVNKYLNELNEYSDRTIYSFSDMTSNIGKFTNAGVGLKDAVAAIQGVSNVAAVAGANANDASRAMYNFAQALSAGYVKLIDWKSIENANMATVEFKNQLLETAVEVGTVAKSVDGYYTVLTKNGQNKNLNEAISATKSFNDSLAYQWMTTDVLIRTLNKYSDTTTEIGKKAAKAATEVKTFSQLIDTLKEALGTGWADTWEIIVGNFEEARDMFSAAQEIFGTIISKSNEARNAVLKEWKSLGGRDDLLATFKNLFNAVMSYIVPIREAFQEVFDPITGEKLKSITGSLKDFTASIQLNERGSKLLKDAFKGLFDVLKVGKDIFTAVLRLALSLAKALSPVASILLSMAAATGRALSGIADIAEVLGDRVANNLRNFFSALAGSQAARIGVMVLQLALLGILKAISALIKGINLLGQAFSSVGINSISDGFKIFGLAVVGACVAAAKAIQSLIQYIGNLAPIRKTIELVSAAFGHLKDLTKDIKLPTISGLKEFLRDGDYLHNAATVIVGAFKYLKTTFTSIATQLKVNAITKFVELFEATVDNFKMVVNKLGALAPIVKTVAYAIGGALKFLFETFNVRELLYIAKSLAGIYLMIAAANMFKGIGKAGREIGELAESISHRIKANTFVTFSTGVAILAASVAVLSAMPTDKALKATMMIGGLVSGLLLLAFGIDTLASKLKVAQRNFGVGSGGGIAAGLLGISASVLVLIKALESLNDVTWENSVEKLKVLGAIFGALVAAATVLNITTGKFSMSAGGTLLILVSALKKLKDVLDEYENFDYQGYAMGAQFLFKAGAAITAFLAVIGFAMKNTNMWGAMISLASLIITLKALLNILEQYRAIDWLKMSIGAKVLANTMLGLAAIMGLMSVFMKNADLSKGAAALLVFGGIVIAVRSLVELMEGIRKTPADVFIAALGSMVIVCKMLDWLFDSMSKINTSWSTVATFGVIIGGLTVAMLLLKDLSIDQAVIGVGTILTVTLGLAEILSRINLINSKWADVLTLGAVIVALTGAVYLLKDISLAQAMNAVGGLAVVLGGLWAALKILELIKLDTTKLYGLAAMVGGFGLVVASLALLTYAAGGDWNRILVAIAGLSACLGAVAGLLLLTKFIQANASSITAVIGIAAALGILSVSLGIIALIPTDKIWTVVGVMVGLASGLTILTAVLIALAKPAEQFAVGIALVIGVIAALTASVMTLSIAVTLISVAVNIFGLGLAALGWGFSTMIELVAKAQPYLDGFKTVMETAGPVIANFLAEISVGILTFTTTLIPLSVGLSTAGAGFAALAVGIGSLAVTVLLLAGSATALGFALQILSTGFEMLGQGIETLFTSIGVGIDNMVQSVTNAFNTLIITAASAGPLFVTTLAMGIVGGAGLIVAAIAGIVSLILGNLGDIVKSAVGVGTYIVQGLTNGIANAASSAISAAKALCAALIGTFTGEFQIKSPSRVMAWIADMIVEGLWRRLLSAVSTIKDAAATLCNAFMTTVQSMFQIHSPSEWMAWIMGNLIQPMATSGQTYGGEVANAGGALAGSFGNSLEQGLANLNLEQTLRQQLGGIDLSGAIDISSIFGGNIDFTMITSSTNNQMAVLDQQWNELVNKRRKVRNTIKNDFKGIYSAQEKAAIQAEERSLTEQIRQVSAEQKKIREQSVATTQTTNMQIVNSDMDAAKKSGGAAKAKADKQKELIADERGYWEKLLAIRQNGADRQKYIDMDLADFEAKIAEDAKQLVDDYVSAIDSGRDSILNKGGIFKAVEQQDAISFKDMKKNLDAHIKQIDEYAITMAQLQDKVKGTHLQDIISDMGVDSLQELKAMNNASSDELNEMVKAYDDAYARAGAAAIYQLKGMKANIEQQLGDMLSMKDLDLDVFMSIYNGSLESLGKFTDQMIDAGKSTMDGFIKASTDEMTGAGKAELIKGGKVTIDGVEHELLPMWKTSGSKWTESAVDGFVETATSEITLDRLMAAAEAMTNAAYEGGMKGQDSHSPSKKWAKLARWAGEGFINSLKSMAGSMADTAQDVTGGVIDPVKDALSRINDLIASDDVQPTISPVLDLTNVQNGLDSLSGGVIGFGSSVNLANSTARGFSTGSFSGTTLADIADIIAGKSSDTTFNNTFNIDGSQDPRLVADEVSRRIQQQVERRTAAWA